MRFYLYARKSTDREDKQAQSLPDQLKYLLKMAEERGYDIVDIIQESQSAKEPGRPLFNKMMEDIKAGKADAILCWKIDRLCRNPIDAGHLQWMLQQNVIKSIQTSDRTYSPNDNVIILGVESSMASQYVIDLKKNVLRGMLEKIEKGDAPSKMPVGYLNDDETKTNIPDPLRFSLVRKMWELMLMGCYSIPQIVDIATNEWGLDQRATKKLPRRPILKSGLYKIFRNPLYAGYYYFSGERYEGRHKPMVTLEEFQRVQDILDNKHVSVKPSKHEHAFTGFMKCAECGYHIVCDVKTKENKATNHLKTYHYYKCSGRGPRCSQVGKSIGGGELEKQIDDYLSSVQIIPELKDLAIARARELCKKDSDAFQGRLDALDKKITSLNKSKNNLLTIFLAEGITQEEYEEQKKQIESNLIAVQTQRQKLSQSKKSGPDQIEKSLDFIQNARTAFIKGDTRKKREIAKAIGQNFLVRERKLFVKPYSWMVPIIGNRDLVCVKNTPSEPLKNLSETALAVPGEALVSTWGPHGESNSGLLDENQLSGPLDDGAENS